MAFDDPATSSDGGSVLLAAVDGRLGLTAAMADCLRDGRRGGSVVHSYGQMLSQRIYGITLGYEDANDADRLRGDAMMRLLVTGDAAGENLASQPSLSRFENAATIGSLYGMGMAVARTVFDFHRRRLGKHVRQITIDMDPTDTPNYGDQQELSFYNGHYDNYCYLPMLSFVSFEDEPDQYLFGAVLRPGNAPAKVGAVGILRRTLAMVRERFPKARVLVRLDGGFSCPELFDFLDAQKRVAYVVGMAENKVLERRVKRPMGTARRLSRESGKSHALFGETLYAAKSWKGCERRVIYKAEVVRLAGREPRNNSRFVVTNLRRKAERVYEVYRMRGESENRIKELQHGLRLDRTSCTKFRANQMGVLMTAAAYVLMQTLRCPLAGTSLARKQVESLRLMLLKIGARVVTSVRRTIIHLAGNHPSYRKASRRPPFMLFSYQVALYALCFWGISASHSLATIRVQPDAFSTRVNPLGSLFSVAPDVATLETGELAVVWSGMRDPDTLYTVDILARLFSSSATAIGSTFIVNSPDPRPSSGEGLPRIAPLPDGAFVTVWENSFDDDGDDYGVFARVVAAMSQPAGEPILVPEVTRGAQTVPVVASLPGGFVVAWQDTGTAGLEASKLLLQRFAYDGTKLGPVVAVTDKAEQNAYAPVVASQPSGEFLIVWEMFDDISGDWRVAGRLFDSQGAKVGNELMFDDERSSLDRAPRVVALGETYLIFWSSFGDGRGIYAREMTANGSFPGLPTLVSGTGRPASPRAATMGDERVVVVWSRTVDSGNDTLAGRIVGIDGVPVTDEFDIEAAGAQRRRAPSQFSVSGINADSFAVVWEQATRDETESEIRLQPFCVRASENMRCGDVSCVSAESSSAGEIDASDALGTLRAAVGLQPCDLCICDVSDSGEVSAIDALMILRFAVGFDVSLACPNCA